MQAFLKGGSTKVKDKDSKDKAGPSGTSSGSGKRQITPWVEKYRPRSVDEVAYQDDVVAVLKKTLEGADLPNLLFYGPPGTGKTSTILAAARGLFGADMLKTRVLELNSSDERGINVIRDKVKRFSQLAASATRPDGKPCPAFKIVILDEADSMTNAAQAALRRTMEKESKTTRFCLICNYVSRIIEPITSRCSKFRFKPLTTSILTDRLKSIAEKENVICSDEAIKALVTTSEGDLRKAITYLQSAHRLKSEEGISENDVYEIAGIIPGTLIDELIAVCYSDSYEKLEKIVKEIMAEGHSASQILSQMHDILVQKPDISDKQKSAIAERLAVIDKRLSDGAEEYLQIMDLCTLMMQQFCHGE
ncbi:replication factor C subunit 4-like [Ptychodera flava]|uniref:replication factor C subunit 4-like n=1 Tax=Ptychodera flava TaxID=63121 RepID=UPI003969CD28